MIDISELDTADYGTFEFQKVNKAGGVWLLLTGKMIFGQERFLTQAYSDMAEMYQGKNCCYAQKLIIFQNTFNVKTNKKGLLGRCMPLYR